MHKYLLIVTFCLTLFSSAVAQESSRLKMKKIVIDAGHGGKDPGAISKNKKYKEKDITLSVALKLGALIKENYPELDVIYTRDRDVFIPLATRTDIANDNKADLFISIHINSAKSTKGNGSETFIMGNSKSKANMEVAKLENSVITLEGENYKEKYSGFDPDIPESYIIFSLLQNAHREQSLSFADLVQQELANNPISNNRGIQQSGFLVLWKTTMPSVLIELGFISNKNDLQALTDKKNHHLFAEKICRAFAKYKKQYESSSIKDTKSSTTIPDNTQNNRDKNNTESETTTQESRIEEVQIEEQIDGRPFTAEKYYSIQILATKKALSPRDRELKGVSNYQEIKDGRFYKYIIGRFKTIQDAKDNLPKYRKRFKDAFPVMVNNNRITMVKI